MFGLNNNIGIKPKDFTTYRGGTPEQSLSISSAVPKPLSGITAEYTRSYIHIITGSHQKRDL